MKLNSLFAKDKNRPRQRTFDETTDMRGVFSYYASRQQADGAERRTGREERVVKHFRWHHLPSIIAVVAIVISLGYVLVLGSQPHVSLASNQQAIAVHTVDDYRQAAQKIFNQSWFDHNKLTVDTGQVSRSMKQQFPELEQVSVTLPLLGHRPLIELTVAQPSFVLVSNNGSFVITDNGVAAAPANNSNQTLVKSLLTLHDNSGLKVSVGKPVLPVDEVSFIKTITAYLAAAHLSVQDLTLPAVPNEVDVRPVGLGYFVKFNILEDARQQTGAFLAVKQKLDNDHANPSQYIDVRVGEKVFYK